MSEVLKSFQRYFQAVTENSFEVVFAIYLLSGILKGIYLANNWPPLFDLTLVSGILLTLLIFKDLSSYGIKTFINKKIWRIISLLLFYLIAIVSITYSPSADYSYYKGVIFSTNILAILSPFFHSNFKVTRFIKIIGFSAVAIGIYSFMVYGFYFSYPNNVLGLTYKFYQVFYLDAGYLLGLASILNLKQTNFKFKIAIINISLILLWATAARGPIIFTFISFLIYFSAITIDYGLKAFFESMHKKRVFIGTLILINVVVLTIVYSTTFGATVLNRTLYRFSVIVPSAIEQTIINAEDHAFEDSGWADENFNNAPSQSNIDRIDHFVYSWNMINKSWKKRILGYGFGSYGVIKTGTDGRLYPHNILLEIWFETGLIGLTVFLTFMIKGMFWTIKNNQHIVGIAVLYLLANTFKSYSLIDHRIIMGVMGIAIFITAKVPAFSWLIIGKSSHKKDLV